MLTMHWLIFKRKKNISIKNCFILCSSQELFDFTKEENRWIKFLKHLTILQQRISKEISLKPVGNNQVFSEKKSSMERRYFTLYENGSYKMLFVYLKSVILDLLRKNNRT